MEKEHGAVSCAAWAILAEATSNVSMILMYFDGDVTCASNIKLDEFTILASVIRAFGIRKVAQMNLISHPFVPPVSVKTSLKWMKRKMGFYAAN